ncbi:MAG: cupin domain-containing protein [Novosphingobium sp.]
MATAAAEKSADAVRFSIYRAADAPEFSEVSCMEMAGLTPIITAGIEAAAAEGADDGDVVKLLFAMPGMSLTYAWFKSGFPLPLHCHNADCLYYIIAGSLKLGSEELGAGDGFFVGCDVPYAYTPGPDGVEVLEFRTADSFDIRFLGKTRTFWDKTAAAIKRERVNWDGQLPPSQKRA